jgi:hypothetical protein
VIGGGKPVKREAVGNAAGNLRFVVPTRAGTGGGVGDRLLGPRLEARPAHGRDGAIAT